MKNLWSKRVHIMIGVSVVLFLTVSILSFVSIRQLQGNARVVNYDGIVRGATQKLMKMEIQNTLTADVDEKARDNLRNRLDRILHALDTGEGEDTPDEILSSIIALPDTVHSGMIKNLLIKWDALKLEIANVRAGTVSGIADTSTLYALSEEYFKLANDTVFAAEAFSESQVANTTTILIVVNAVFILFVLVGGVFLIRGMAVRRRADMLGKIAYMDPLTQLENRASCERLIERLKENPTHDSVAVLMFDMNNLKLTNDFLGHKSGDQLILHFAQIISDEAKDYGFVGRYGGDEFLGIFENADEARAEEYLSRVSIKISAYNSMQASELEKISYAAGLTVGTLASDGIDDMIYEADRNMYANKRKMKEKNSPQK